MQGGSFVRCLCGPRSVMCALRRVGVLFVFFRILHFAFHSVCPFAFLPKHRVLGHGCY